MRLACLPFHAGARPWRVSISARRMSEGWPSSQEVVMNACGIVMIMPEQSGAPQQFASRLPRVGRSEIVFQLLSERCDRLHIGSISKDWETVQAFLRLIIRCCAADKASQLHTKIVAAFDFPGDFERHLSRAKDNHLLGRGAELPDPIQ